MMFIAYLILICTTFMQDDQRTRMIFELANHGARAIIFPQFNTTAQPWLKNQTHGEPTATGMREQYLLGRNLRELFMHSAYILKEKYDDYQVIVKAAPFQSPIISAYTQMMGFYTPGVGEVLTEIEQGIAIPPVEDTSVLDKEKAKMFDMGLPYYAQIVPVHSNEGYGDFLFLPLMECNIVKYILYNTTQMDAYISLNNKYSALFKQLEKVMNYKDFNLTSAAMLFDDIDCDRYDGKDVRYDIDINIILELEELVIDYWNGFVFADERTRFISNTYMFSEWITIMNNVLAADRKNTPIDQTLNFALYMGSSYNIIPVLITFGYKLTHRIGYSAQLLLIMGRKMESLNKTPETLIMSDYEVFAKLNGSVISTFGEMGISADVLITKLQQHSYINLLPHNAFLELCNAIPPTPPGPTPTPKSHKGFIIGFSIGGGFLFLIVIFGAIWLIIRKRKEKEGITSYTAPTDPILSLIHI